MKRKILSRRYLQKLLIYLFLDVALLLIFFVFLVPKIKNIFGIRKELQTKEEKVLMLDQKAKALEKLSLDNLQSDYQLVSSVLPQEKDFFLVLSLVKGVFQANQVSLISFDVNPGVVSTASGKMAQGGQMDFTVAFKGSLENLVNVIRTIHSVAPLMSVSDLSFLAKGDVYSEEKEGTLKITAYFLPQEKTVIKLESPLPLLSQKEIELKRSLQAYIDKQAEFLAVQNFGEENVILGKEDPFF